MVLAYRPEYVLGMLVTDETLVKADPIEVDGKVIGYILAAPEQPGFTAEELAYLRQTYRAVALAAAAALILAAAISAAAGLCGASYAPTWDVVQKTYIIE